MKLAVPRAPHPGRHKTPVERLQHQAAAFDAAVKALLAHARETTGHESDGYRAVARYLLSKRNEMIRKIISRGGHYYTGTRVKLELMT